MNEISFAHPNFLYGLILIPLLAFYLYRRRDDMYAGLSISNLKGMEQVDPSLRVRLLPLIDVLRMVVFSALIIALARPQSSMSEKEVSTEGIDIVLALDISSSMLARDFKPDRLEAAKQVASKFVESRPTDRIGLVVFAGESFTQCPITTDHTVLLNLFEKVKSGLVEDGTAIGMGLATAVNRLKDSEAKSRVIILMTDGVNNAGYVDPMTAIELAKSENLRVYTIGIGTNGKAPYPDKDAFGRTVYVQMDVEIDEALLKQIADETGGSYYRATEEKSLADIYQEIDKLEKSKINVSTYERKSELFYPFAMAAILALFLELLLKYTYLRRLG